MPRASTILSLAALLLVTVLYTAWTPREGLGQLGRDGPRYMMMAEHYSLRPGTDAIYAGMATFSHLPPLYPVVLAWSGSADDLARAHLVTTACLLLALLTCFAWMRQTGASVAQGTLLVLLFAMLPGTWDTALLIQSEFLYLLLSMAALAVLAAYGREPRRELLLAAAVIIGASMLCRAVGICLLPALLLAARRENWRLIVIAMLLALLPSLAWNTLHHSTQSYGGMLPAVYGAAPWQALIKQLGRELPALRIGFEANFVIGQRLLPLVDTLGLLCLVSLLWRAVRLRPDASYLAASCVVMLLWPFPEDAQRFLWVTLPAVLLQPVLLLAELRREGTPASHSALPSAALAGVLLLTLLTPLELRAERYWEAPVSGIPGAREMNSWYGADPVRSRKVVFAENAFVGAISRIAEQVPETDCVLATRPDLVSYYARRRAVAPPLNSTPDPLFTALVGRSGCRYAFGMGDKDSIYPELFFPLTRLQGLLQVRYVSYLHDNAPDDREIIAILAKLAPLPDARPLGNLGQQAAN